jgi:Undecaprenyl-phosphate glucose phosphotransferase
MLRAPSRLLAQLTLASDLVLIAGCWVAAYMLRFHLLGPFPIPRGLPPFQDYALQLLPILAVWAVAFHTFGLYRPRRLGSYLSEWMDVAKASSVGVLVLIATMTFFFRGYEYSRLVILYFWVLSIVSVSLFRALFREMLRFARRRGYNLRHAIIVGSGEVAAEMARMLHRRPDIGIQVRGFVSDRPELPGTKLTWLGAYKDLRPVLDGTGRIDIIFLALPYEEYGVLAQLLGAIGDDPVTIHLVPDVFSLVSLRGGIEEFEGIPLIHLRESPLHGWSRILKHAFDLTFGSVALILAAPFMATIALLIRLTSPGSVLLRQERMGLDGRRFQMLKFRTMREHAEVDTGPVWATPNDVRRTPIGVFLRRWSLDELPQLFNVLRGEMSLVGPRPERPLFVDEFRRKIPGYMLRHKVKAGMTGWAQINGWRGQTSLEKRIEYDLYYIERWSLVFDLKILVQTIWRGFFSKSAY